MSGGAADMARALEKRWPSVSGHLAFQAILRLA